MVYTMTDNEQHACKIVGEFCHLLEKSKQLFNGLRDLPQYGHKQWQTYFGRTFDIYTKLWKFQQQHRQILDSKYGLKRWQIGEIASKIGQLYYHYYLRTSETNYLNEAFSFYSAIRTRAYYSKANKEDRPDLMVKKLRYYARFIVVCLLLKKMKLVREIVRELSKQIDDYTSIYEPEDQLEWSMVLGEVKSFIEADAIVNVIDEETSTSVIISHRLGPQSTYPIERTPAMNLSLQEILIIGNYTDQVKFSELSLDMFRMLQSLEREPQEETAQVYDVSPAPGRIPFENGDRTGKRDNPHKYLLYKPTISQFLLFLTSGFKELPPNGVLLLYISADGNFSTVKHPEDAGYDLGGVVMHSKRDVDHSNRRNLQLKEPNCLYPGDLYPYTRKPIFLIVDSDNSQAFQLIPRYFGQPFVTLMSATEMPTGFHGKNNHHNKGNLFTLFLHSPLSAFCFVCNIVDVPATLWDECHVQVDQFLAETAHLFTRSRSLDHAFVHFLGDDFLRLLLLRFVFCYVVLKMHRSFKGPNYYPRSQPSIPESEILEHPTLHKYVLEVANLLGVSSMFFDANSMQED
ncbi:hypothetical protein CHUAL_009752 [Chamberlinius hualienensis]